MGGRAKVVNYYNERYMGSLTQDDCERLEKVMELDESNGSIGYLKHVIYELSDSDTRTIIEETNADGAVHSNIDFKTGELRDDQTLGAAFMFFAKNCILGDSVGLGKTVETAALIQILKDVYKKENKTFRFLLLTEKNLVEQTRFKMVKFLGQFVETLYGEAKDVNKFSKKYPLSINLGVGLVGTHSLFNQKLFIEWLQQSKSMGLDTPFDLLIVDESSILGNSASGISKNAKELLPLFDRVVFLNATPFESRLDIFYNQLSLLDKNLLPTKANFSKEYVVYDYRGMYPKPTGKYKNQAAFKHLVGYRYFARTREDKGAEMIDCQSVLLTSPLSKLQKYWLQRTKMPQMIFDCPNAVDESVSFCEYNVPKLTSLRKALEEYCEDANTVLMFVHYRQAQDSLSQWLTDMGYSNRVLCGATPNAERDDIIRGFKNSEFRVLITNVQKGLDFGDCNYCIFYSFDPNPSKMIQFEGRITRSFDIVGKTIILLCSEGRELDRLNNVIKERAKASVDFTKVDLSCIMDLLLED